MELSRIVFVQVLIIFVLMAVGFVCSKARLINEKGTRQMTDVLLLIVMPCVLIKAYQKEFSKELIFGLLMSALFALVIHIIGIVISTLIFKREESLRYRINIFSSVYSNCGFMAIPLLDAAVGTDGVFYGSAYLAVFTILNWTHGICLYSGSLKEISVKKIITNPGIIGTTIAIILFVTGIKLPYVLEESVSYLAGLNTPLAMIVTGAYLTRVDFKKALKNVSIYLVSVLRLVIVPIIAVVVAKIINIDALIAKSVLISAACPTAAIAALFATKYELDSTYAAEVVSITTILSVVTIPLVLMLF